ncbi:MAG: RNA methyltransferase [Bacteroidetes bacterium]|nr:RNA methyltransferase [Bacteroidota bacterium]
MAYNEYLADRVRQNLKEKHVAFEEKKMMGGLCILVDDKMCVGIMKDELMARIDPEIYEASLHETGCHQMDFTGKIMKGFVLIRPEGIDREDDLNKWIHRCLEFNPKAKSSKKKKK